MCVTGQVQYIKAWCYAKQYQWISTKGSQKVLEKNKTTDAYLINSCCLCRTEISFSSYNVL